MSASFLGSLRSPSYSHFKPWMSNFGPTSAALTSRCLPLDCSRISMSPLCSVVFRAFVAVELSICSYHCRSRPSPLATLQVSPLHQFCEQNLHDIVTKINIYRTTSYPSKSAKALSTRGLHELTSYRCSLCGMVNALGIISYSLILGNCLNSHPSCNVATRALTNFLHRAQSCPLRNL